MSEKPMIVTEDIFGKAARRYCERRGINPNDLASNWTTNEAAARQELEILCDKILALYEVGALPKINP